MGFRKAHVYIALGVFVSAWGRIVTAHGGARDFNGLFYTSFKNMRFHYSQMGENNLRSKFI